MKSVTIIHSTDNLTTCKYRKSQVLQAFIKMLILILTFNVEYYTYFSSILTCDGAGISVLLRNVLLNALYASELHSEMSCELWPNVN